MAKKRNTSRKARKLAAATRAQAPTGAAGALLGKHFVTIGEKQEPTKRQRWRVPGGTIVTDDATEVFRARVEPFSLDSIVSRAAGLTRQRVRDEREFQGRLRSSGVSIATFSPFLLRRLVTGAISARSLPDTSEKTIGVTDLQSAEQALMDVVATADRHAGDDSAALWSLAMRQLQSQYYDQLGEGAYIRELWLGRRVIERAAESGLDIDDYYRRALGLTHTDLAVLSFTAFATIIGDESTGLLDPTTWISETSPLKVDPDIVRAFFDVTAIDYQGIQERAGHRAVVRPGYEPYALSPIIKWPLVQRSDGLYLAPVTRDVLDRPTRGFHIDVFQLIPEQLHEAVKDAMAEVYESYVERLLQLALPGSPIHRGKSVLPTDRPNCDFVCVEGQSLTLVEVKSSRLSLEADMTKDPDVLRRELKLRGISHGLTQISESARAIRDRRTTFARNSILTGLLVIRGEQVWMNTPEIRRMLEELVREETGNNIFVKYQIVNDQGFDLLTRYCAGNRGLGKFLQDKCSHTGTQHEDFEDAVGRVFGAGASSSLLAKEQREDHRKMLLEYGVVLDDPAA